MRKNNFFKGMLTIAMCGIISMSYAVPVSATQNNTNTDISQQCGYTLKSNGNFLKKICDSNTYSNTTFNTGDTIVVYCDSQTIASIYVVSDSPTGTYTISSGGTEQNGGENGFLHDYSKLQTPSNTVEITILEDNVSIDEVYVFADGTLPDWVQIWSPPVEKADMLLLPTHTDDEYLMFGGTIPYYAGERGLSVQVAFMTNNETEPYRMHESLNALWAGGMKNYPIIGEFEDKYLETIDAAKTTYDVNKLEEFQVNMIRRFKPQVVIGHDPNGEYGHGAHMLNTDVLKTALESAKDDTKFTDSATQYGVWDVPKTYLHLYSENQVNMDWGVTLSKFNGQTAIEVATNAFNQYKSQQQNYYVHQEQDGSAYDCHIFGLYRNNVAADTGKNDFMENLTPYAEQPAQTEPIQTEVPADSNGDTQAVNGSVSTVTTLVQQSQVSAGSKIGFWICMFICLIAVVIMWVVCAQMAKEKKAQQKKMEEMAMRKKQQGQRKKRPINNTTEKLKKPNNTQE